MGDRLARVVAYYLPQFHPVPENDTWWGKGFTEWTNVAKAKPLFRGHYQPHVPADLGFYDLRVPETRAAQAEMAREYGVEAFCYYDYWFGGRRLLERPLTEVLRSGAPDFPFCVCWANHTWRGMWSGCPGRTLIEQTYPGLDDHKAHFEALLPAFEDRRYLRVDGKPLFVVYAPRAIPEVLEFIHLWRNLAAKAGLEGLHLVGITGDNGRDLKEWGFDATTPHDNLPRLRSWVSKRDVLKWLANQYYKRNGRPTIYHYKKMVREWERDDRIAMTDYPLLIPNWDNTPRGGSLGLVLHESTPELFRLITRKTIRSLEFRPFERRIVFVKSWNEWAEGNHLEPDLKYGTGYLRALRDEIYAPNTKD